MLLFGVLPALRAGHVDVQTVLQQAGRPGMSGGYRGARRTLVAGELALSVVLLWGAVLLRHYGGCSAITWGSHRST
jgi:hypothetical protein